MASNVAVGVNSFDTLANIASYLEDSPAANLAWQGIDEDSQKRYAITAWRILNRQTWEGCQAGLNSVATIAVNAGGTGYAVNDVVTVSNGTGTSAQATVAAVSSGVVTSLTLLHTGFYSVNPSASGEATTGGTGSGLTVDLTFGDQFGHFPATGLTDKDELAATATAIPDPLKEAQAELAWALSQDANLEATLGQGSNVSEVQAGSARVKFFAATGGVDGSGSVRFPPAVQELVAPFLSGASASYLPQSFNTDGTSGFSTSPDVSEGLA